MIYVYCFTLPQGQCKYLSNTFRWPCENILGSVSVHIIYGMFNDHTFLQIHIN